MHISWLGGTTIKLQTKNNDQDITIVIDPYKQEKGSFPRNLAPDIALFSRGEKNSITLSPQTFVIDTLGEMELKKVMVYSLPGFEQIIFKINSEELNIVHLGNINKKIENGIMDKIGVPDILFIPVGGSPYLEIKDAVDLITAMEPRIVIPMAYKSDNEPNLKPIEDFLKESGLKPDIQDKKVIIKQKDLPQEETKLILLEKGI